MSSTMPDVFITANDASALNRLLSELTHADESDESTLELSTKLFDAHIVGSRALPNKTSAGQSKESGVQSFSSLKHDEYSYIDLLTPRLHKAPTLAH